MLTAKGEEEDELQGFSLGADEYIMKPFSLKILLARIEAVFRRGAEAAPAAPARSPPGWRWIRWDGRCGPTACPWS